MKKEKNIKRKNKTNNKKKFDVSLIIESVIVTLISIGVLIVLVLETNEYYKKKINSDYLITVYHVIDKVKESIKSGKIDVSNENATYYIPLSCVNEDNEFKSPYGDFKEANIAVVQKNGKYMYLWNSVDTEGYGVDGILEYNRITENEIKPNLTKKDLITNIAFYDTNEIITLNNDCSNQKSNKPLNLKAICIRATSLHSNIYNDSKHYGNDLSSVKPKVLTFGDAFDCDINYDGIYDEKTERFYYLSSNDKIASLIYYKNTENKHFKSIKKYKYADTKTTTEKSTFIANVVDSKDAEPVPLYDVEYLWPGPNLAYLALPTISEWTNSKLLRIGERQITTNSGKIFIKENNIAPFTYKDRVARFLTIEEVGLCNKKHNCSFLLENIENNQGYWLENRSDSGMVYAIESDTNGNILLNEYSADYYGFGVRPVISVRIEDIIY